MLARGESPGRVWVGGREVPVALRQDTTQPLRNWAAYGEGCSGGRAPSWQPPLSDCSLLTGGEWRRGVPVDARERKREREREREGEGEREGDGERTRERETARERARAKEGERERERARESERARARQ